MTEDTKTIFIQFGDREIEMSAPEGFWYDTCEARITFVKDRCPTATRVKDGAGDSWTISQSVV